MGSSAIERVLVFTYGVVVYFFFLAVFLAFVFLSAIFSRLAIWPRLRQQAMF